MTVISFSPGNQVIHNNTEYRIAKQLDLHRVLVVNMKSGEYKTLYVRELGHSHEDQTFPPTDLNKKSKEVSLLSDEDWHTAQKRFDAIRPFVSEPEDIVSRADVTERANQFGVSTATLYRWIKRFRDSGKISSLVPHQRGVKAGSYKLDGQVNAIINAVIEDNYLTSQKKSIQWVCDEVTRLCKNAKFPQPHPNTVRQRIAKLSEKSKLKQRFGSKAAENRFSPIQGEFPDGSFPLDVVQIDHTKLDIILVDDIHRMPVDRPWITLAIDVYSRMVTGFYISFDPPGALATGLCLAHSILPKEQWLEKYGTHSSWPVWGVMKTIHADNAKEFRGEMLKRACTEYGIDLSWRPVARPHYGAHIERLLGTFNKEIHNLAGTTFNNPVLRKNYNSEKASAMTLSEFERWLTIYITDIYHQRMHSALNCSPIIKYEQGILGDDDKPGVGLPSKIQNEQRLRLDFMPYEMRTVQRYGVQIDKCFYFADILRPYINMTEKGNSKAKRKFLFRRDPRDISTLYFYDPELCEYFPIPYRNSSHPAISIWEYRAAKKMAEGLDKNANEDAIFEAYGKLRELEENARQETKKIRRNKQRKRHHASQDKPFIPNRPQVEPDDELFNNIVAFKDKEVFDDDE